MNLNYYVRQGYARTIASNAGLHLVESEKVSQPFTDGRTIWVPIYDPDWIAESPQEIEWWGFLIHETYHNDRNKKHNRHFVLLKERIEEMRANKKQPKKVWKELTNVLEDLRIEKREYGTYVFQDRVMSTLRSVYMRKCRDDAGILSVDPIRSLVYMIQWLGFARWNAGVLGEDVLGWNWSDDVLDLYKKVEDLMPYVYDLDTAEDVFLVTEEILKRIFDTDDPEEAESEEPCEEGDEGDGEPEDGEGGEEGKGKPKYVLVEHGKKYDLSDLPDPDETRYVYRPSTVPGKFPGGIPLVEIKTKNLKASADEGSDILRHAKSSGLASQIKRYLMVRSAVRMNGGHKRGVIDSGNMWKGVVYNNTDTGKRVFKQKEEELNLDTAVTLLVDTSGSMRGFSKVQYASAAAVVLNDVFAKVGVKCRVAGFTDTISETHNYVHKEFDEKVQREELARRLDAGANKYMGGNADGESVLWEYSKLIRRAEPKKVLIVLSDGMPCDSKSLYNVSEHTEDVVRSIEKEGRVTIVGIGILDSSVARFYSRHHTINDVTNIEEVLLNLLKKEVLHA